MNRAFTIIALVAVSSSFPEPLFADWVIHSPGKNDLYFDHCNLIVSGKGEPEDTAIIKISYQINGKWLVAHETDITVNDKGQWETDCKPPVPLAGYWPIADGPNPTPYRVELIEGKTVKGTTDFRVVSSKKKS